MLRRDQQWTAAEEAAPGTEPVIWGGFEAGKPPGMRARPRWRMACRVSR